MSLARNDVFVNADESPSKQPQRWAMGDSLLELKKRELEALARACCAVASSRRKRREIRGALGKVSAAQALAGASLSRGGFHEEALAAVRKAKAAVSRLVRRPVRWRVVAKAPARLRPERRRRGARTVARPRRAASGGDPPGPDAPATSATLRARVAHCSNAHERATTRPLSSLPALGVFAFWGAGDRPTTSRPEHDTSKKNDATVIPAAPEVRLPDAADVERLRRIIPRAWPSRPTRRKRRPAAVPPAVEARP